jgi:adenylate cyclase
MLARRILYYQLRVLLAISFIWVVFGFIFVYNILEIEKQLLTSRSLLLFSLAFAITGFVISAVLIFYLKYAFRDYSLWVSVLLKLLITFVLFIIIAFVLLALYFVFSYHGELSEYTMGFFNDVFRTRPFVVFMIDLGILTFISIILLEVTDKYGPGGFWRVLRGEYNKPRVENRIFIFLDINNATGIAELLGHEKYFLLLKDFFSDITNPIIANGGEIYQYVGDEVVLSWPTSSVNKIYCLKFIRHAYYTLKRKEKKYMGRYQVAPGFKAGIHAGEVTAGFIGIIKKDLVYSGDTLNTAARIRSMCHSLNESFVLSGSFMADFPPPFSYHIRDIGELELKGRAEKEKLYSLSFE